MLENELERGEEDVRESPPSSRGTRGDSDCSELGRLSVSAGGGLLADSGVPEACSFGPSVRRAFRDTILYSLCMRGTTQPTEQVPA